MSGVGPRWDHPLECGHTVRLDHPKPSRRIRYHCPACSAMRRLGRGEVTYRPAPAPERPA